MIAYIPLASCQLIDTKLTDELNLIVSMLNDHKLIDGVFIHPTNEYYPKYLSLRLDGRGGEIDKKRYKPIAECSLHCYEMAVKRNDEFFLMCNSNKMQRWIPYLDTMTDYMNEDERCGMVAPSHIKVKKSPVHVCAGFAMHRTDAIRHVELYQIMSGDRQSCHCPVLAREIRAHGYTAEYIYK